MRNTEEEFAAKYRLRPAYDARVSLPDGTTLPYTYKDVQIHRKDASQDIRAEGVSGTMIYIDLDENDNPIVVTASAGKLQKGAIIFHGEKTQSKEPLDAEKHADLLTAYGLLFSPETSGIIRLEK